MKVGRLRTPILVLVSNEPSVRNEASLMGQSGTGISLFFQPESLLALMASIRFPCAALTVPQNVLLWSRGGVAVSPVISAEVHSWLIHDSSRFPCTNFS